MSTPLPAAETERTQARSQVVNDFSIQVATVNGSGSQTANLVLLRSIFQMGIPVSGKNLFPSNIAGLPTWYTIRANRRGYISRKKEIDFLVAMNPESAKEDVMSLEPGRVVVYDEPLKLDALRSDLIFYPVPFDKIVAEVCTDAKLRRLVKNMIYDGVLAELLSIELGEMEKALAKQLGKKPKAMALNMGALEAGKKFAVEHLERRHPYRVERMNKTAGQILIEGNAAAAMGCMFAGVTVVAWYPITPSSSLPESLISYMRKYRMDKDGKATFAIVQAEDEIAALGMVVGASWAGARAMTSTSGPGISLMSEFAGLAYYAEVPAVVFDIQRVGPSTGLPTRTAQGDLLFVALNSHGDTRHVMLLPASVQECFDMSIEAFNLSERLQTIVFVMSDLDLGMNNWMAHPFEYPDQPFDRGKVLDEAKLRSLNASWGRYKDIDGDGIPWRTLPGTNMPSFFTRGSGHNENAVYTERPDDYVRNVDRLAQKFHTARSLVPKPVVDHDPEAKVGIIAFGSSHWAVEESRDQLREEAGLRTSYLRLRAYPFTPEVDEFIRKYDRIYVVEQNRDAQMLSLLLMDGEAQFAERLRSVLHYNGLPIDARSITDDVLEQEGSRPKRRKVAPAPAIDSQNQRTYE
ncbi:MAG TPA: 2-oxoacid:acceptor oxidoreductase subunit alpha [Vicinamibacterales bacterium]|nr:2-oxoacid:acceptor oxidoreductase subunit alpha [Vicinamibacterales bacterium]